MAGIISLVLVVIFALCLVFQKKSDIESDDLDLNAGAGYMTNEQNGDKGGVNNPGFLIHTNTNWVGKTTLGNPKFENFDSLGNGVRAWGINLFNKIKKGQITSTNQMIDVLTPAISENPEPARNNYKANVAKAKTWKELFVAVFDFEANPSWKNCSDAARTEALNYGFTQAINYCYNGNIPSYFKS